MGSEKYGASHVVAKRSKTSAQTNNKQSTNGKTAVKPGSFETFKELTILWCYNDERLAWPPNPKPI